MTALAVLAFAGPAGAAAGQVSHIRLSGTFADVVWVTGSATTSTITSVSVSKLRQGSSLDVDQFVANFDSSGNFTGGTDTSAVVTSGFSFTLQQPLAGASLSGLGLPGRTCTVDVNGNLTGCTSTSIDVTGAWTGQGPISRGVSQDHFKVDGFSKTDHFNGTVRDGTATGTFNGSTLTAGDVQFADLGTLKSGTVTVCIGLRC